MITPLLLLLYCLGCHGNGFFDYVPADQVPILRVFRESDYHSLDINKVRVDSFVSVILSRLISFVLRLLWNFKETERQQK